MGEHIKETTKESLEMEKFKEMLEYALSSEQMKTRPMWQIQGIILNAAEGLVHRTKKEGKEDERQD